MRTTSIYNKRIKNGIKRKRSKDMLQNFKRNQEKGKSVTGL